MAYDRSWTITIKAPREEVFDYLTDVTRHVEWGSDMTTSTAREPGPPAVGKAYEAEGILNGKPNKSVVTITSLEAPSRFAFDATDSNSVFHHEFTLSGGGDATTVARRMTMPKGPFMNPIFMRLFQGVIDKNYNGALVKLKNKMESGA
jgi:uncharacterized protein YndB with AHSA1/START domain